MNLHKRIQHLSNTPLPDDLLKRLHAAKRLLSQRQQLKEINSIEVACFKQGIYIHYPEPAPKTNHVLGQLIDSRL